LSFDLLPGIGQHLVGGIVRLLLFEPLLDPLPSSKVDTTLVDQVGKVRLHTL
jgi:hypothetical protein